MRDWNIICDRARPSHGRGRYRIQKSWFARPNAAARVTHHVTAVEKVAVDAPTLLPRDADQRNTAHHPTEDGRRGGTETRKET